MRPPRPGSGHHRLAQHCCDHHQGGRRCGQGCRDCRCGCVVLWSWLGPGGCVEELGSDDPYGWLALPDGWQPGPDGGLPGFYALLIGHGINAWSQQPHTLMMQLLGVEHAELSVSSGNR